MRLTFCIQVPLEDEAKKYKGTMTMFHSKRPKVFPRIGERVYILPGITPKIVEIIHMGEDQYFSRIVLEPVPGELRKELEARSPVGKATKWKWSEKEES
jgi:hypothetical protein